MIDNKAVSALTLRDCGQEDSADLTLLADVAGRGMGAYIWSQAADVGQSAFEVGRDIIRNQARHFGFYKNWRIADIEGCTVGAINGYAPQPADLAITSNDKVLKPISELKSQVLGSWYISTLGVYPEYRGKGVGKALLAEAENQARILQKRKVTLIVGTFNPMAHTLYARTGYRELDRRISLYLNGASEVGEWVLMAKDL